ncbi:MAG: transposase [Dysgonamonadaceae bacterium]|jgi:transposase|nr:transposase [Dysgonamonadaceae bacterium]
MKLVAGIDVSKDGLEVCMKERTLEGKVKIKRTHSFTNDNKGFQSLLEWSNRGRDLPPLTCVMEATGSYYEELAYFLYDHGQEVCVMLANKVKHYAKSLNVKTKTDRVDTGVIADFGMERSHQRWEPMSAEYRLLRDLCRELLSMKKELSRAKCQLHAKTCSISKHGEVVSIKSEQIKFYEDVILRVEYTTFIDAVAVMEFFRQLREDYVDKPVKIVLDNARYQHCKAVMEVVQSLNIELLFLPPYSPNLNIIERLWKFTKKKILYGTYYETPLKFHDTVKDFFETVNAKYKPELEALLTLNFQFFEEDDYAQNYAA